MLTFHIASAAIAGPGLDGWENARPVLTGAAPYRPEAIKRYAPQILPATECRRSSASTRLAVHVANEATTAAGMATDGMAAVFASANSDGQIAHQICEALAAPERMVSPTRFHNSVHNAPAGYWSIATGSRMPSTSLAGFDTTFAAGLVAACAQLATEQVPVLLAAYDLPFPEPLHEKRPIAAPFAAALVLLPRPARSCLATATLEVTADPSVTRMTDGALEALRRGNPAARALPLLAALAKGIPGEATVGYGENKGVIVRLQP